jgi:hypothetical protein
MVAPNAHHIGSTKSAPRPKAVNVSQNIFRSMLQVYMERLKTDVTFDLSSLPISLHRAIALFL